VKGIELESLLEKLNSRIEALYDREHTLGHAFFMPVKNALDAGDEEAAFKQLKIAFQKKIIRCYRNTFSMTGTRSGWCWQTTKNKTTACNS
jgi:5-methylcytosine-specific restriction protein B